MKTWLKQILLAALVLAGGRIGFSETAKTPPAKPAAPAKPVPAKPVPAKSVFVVPATTREGRDPFYPESTRLAEAAATANHATESAAEAATLKISGFSSANGKRMVIINNHTFATGDERDLMNAGARVHIRCLDIRSNSVIIEVNGRPRELTFGAK